MLFFGKPSPVIQRRRSSRRRRTLGYFRRLQERMGCFVLSYQLSLGLSYMLHGNEYGEKSKT